MKHYGFFNYTAKVAGGLFRFWRNTLLFYVSKFG